MFVRLHPILHYKLKEKCYISSLYFSPIFSPVFGMSWMLSKPEMTGMNSKNFNVTNIKKVSKQGSDNLSFFQ